MNKNSFGYRLLMLRKARKITGQKLAELLGVSQSRVSKIECGAIRPTREYVEAFSKALSLSESEREELQAHAELFWSEFAPWTGDEEVVAKRQQDAIFKLKTSATQVRSFHMAVVPSQLQTELYLHAVIGKYSPSIGYSAFVPEREYQTKLRWQKGIGRRKFYFLISEGALRTRIAAPVIMAEQFAKLKEMSEKDNVQIGVIPWATRIDKPPITGFEIYDDKLVSIETISDTIHITNEEHVMQHREVFNSLSGSALYGSPMMRLLDQIHSDLRKLEP
ncbi:MAG: helix-turn-helix domain-containing protein [Alphaproteobacteria bacterium]|nr:helix-turn-helix domain-containing protein [Alphaproteobacteria bacterium]